MKIYRAYGKQHTNFYTLAEWLIAREEFHNVSKTFYSATPPISSGFAGYGWLPDDWSRLFTARRHVIDYVIYSYNTPIAWHDHETLEWIVPDESYSKTTARHQSAVHAGLSVINREHEYA